MSEFLCVSCNKRLSPAAPGWRSSVNTPAGDSISHKTLLRSDFSDNIVSVRSLRCDDRVRDMMDWSISLSWQQPCGHVRTGLCSERGPVTKAFLYRTALFKNEHVLEPDYQFLYSEVFTLLKFVVFLVWKHKGNRQDTIFPSGQLCYCNKIFSQISHTCATSAKWIQFL